MCIKRWVSGTGQCVCSSGEWMSGWVTEWRLLFVGCGRCRCQWRPRRSIYFFVEEVQKPHWSGSPCIGAERMPETQIAKVWCWSHSKGVCLILIGCADCTNNILFQLHVFADTHMYLGSLRARKWKILSSWLLNMPFLFMFGWSRMGITVILMT